MVALTAVMLSIELILGLAAWSSRLPPAADPAFVHSMVWHVQTSFKPQRNLSFYFFWMGLALAAYVGIGARMKFGLLRTGLKPFLIFQALVVCLMGHSGFAILGLGNPVWAWPVFWSAFAAGLSACVFWPEFLAVISYWKTHNSVIVPVISRMGMWLGGLFIFLVVFMPDIQAVVAMVYMGDYFRNWDFSLFGPVFAIDSGLVPCVDVDVPYGFGATVVLAKLVKLMGGFEYVKILAIVMWMGIVYFILWFFLLRQCLGSGLLAFAAVVWAMRVQMFSSTTGAIVWVPMMSSFLRYCFDIGVFWMLWMHMRTRRTVFLGLAAFFVSLALYHMLQSGIYIFLVFALYLLGATFVPCLGGKNDRMLWRNHALILGSVAVWTGLWFYMSVGPVFLQETFRHNLLGNGSLYVKGIYGGSLAGSISPTNIVQGLGGFLYPAFCMVSFLYVIGKVMAGEAGGRDIFAGLLAFYALLFHSYYMLMVNSWYTYTLPGIFLLFYWIAEALDGILKSWRPWVVWGVVVAVLYCLLTSSMFTGYPNLLSLSRNPVVDTRVSIRVGPRQVPYFHQLLADYPEAIKLPVNSAGEKDEHLKYEKDFTDDGSLKSYYAAQTSWPEDAALIRRLTPPDARVPVLSSFEVLLLQRAGRSPFFYHFPLLNSRPLTVRNFMVTDLLTYPQLQQVIDQLEVQKPTYIFMERIFLTPQVPAFYFYQYDDLIFLLRYVFSHYEPAAAGRYLVAMKRVR